LIGWAVTVAAIVLGAAPIAPDIAHAVLHADQPAAGAEHAKRGVASSRYLASDPAVLSRIGAAWAYDWSATPPPRRAAAEWVPMVWGAGSLTPPTIASLTVARRVGRARDLLGFNEPDSPSQSNLTPEDAARLWPALEQTGLRLGSPAPAVPTDGWLARFMSLVRARHLRVDFVALHYYQDFTNPDAVGELRRQLLAIHDQYHKPIWITEIGALDLRRWHEPMLHPPTNALAIAYMRKLFAMLDGLRFVERYAWFTDDCWSDTGCRSSSLFTGSGQLTPTGSTFKTAP
jgi:Glycosyl hydrolase catalytic core